ncbi:hypothetical protein BGLA2_2050011 [Burkholderia gladioli]|nr:hypothetical protein BGLA2_2050011 [Burkholderia gladioli]
MRCFKRSTICSFRRTCRSTATIRTPPAMRKPSVNASRRCRASACCVADRPRCSFHRCFSRHRRRLILASALPGVFYPACAADGAGPGFRLTSALLDLSFDPFQARAVSAHVPALIPRIPLHRSAAR